MNDIQFRTDQFNAQNKQFYDAQRFQAMSHMGQAIGNTAQSIVQNRQANAHLDMRRVMTEIASREADSALRLQEIEAERQLQQNKMASMLMMDQLDQSRLQVDMGKESLRAARLQNDQNEELRKTRTRSAAAEYIGKLQSIGYVEDEKTGQMRPATEDELASMANRMGSDGSNERLWQAEYRQRLQGLRSSYYMMGQYIGSPDKRGWVESQISELERRLSVTGAPPAGGGSGGGGAPLGGGGAQPGQASTLVSDTIRAGWQSVLQQAGQSPDAGPPPDVQVPEDVQKMAYLSDQVIQRHPQWSRITQQMKGDDRASLLYAMGVYANDIAPKTDPRMAAQFVMDALNGTGRDAAYFMTVANFSDEHIRQVLLSRGASEDAVNAALKERDDYIARLKEGR